MREKRISRLQIILVFILLCGLCYYFIVFIIPNFIKNEDGLNAELSSSGEFYSSNVSAFEKSLMGECNLLVKFKGAETEYFPPINGAYSINTRQINMITSSDKGYQFNRFIENEKLKVKGNYYGKLYSVLVDYKISAFTGKGYPREPYEEECLGNFYVNVHS